MFGDDYARLICKSGEILNKRYRVLNEVGDGGFSDVYLAVDLETNKNVIIKSYRKLETFREAAIREIKIMQILNKLDKEQTYFVEFYGSFYFKKHLCLIFQQYGISLYQALVAVKQFSLNITRIIMRQVCEATALLHHNGMIHTDIKPENILLPVDYDLKNFDHIYSEAPSQIPSDSDDGQIGMESHTDEVSSKMDLDIRLIDFGSLSTSNKWHYILATTRRYRAPEILLGERWGVECDIWSLGCIMIELVLGYIPFDAKDDLDHLFLIQHTIGSFPERMSNECIYENIKTAFDGDLINPDYLSDDKRNLFLPEPPLLELLTKNVNDNNYIDLCIQMLEPDPSKRPSIDNVINHPFFQNN